MKALVYTGKQSLDFQDATDPIPDQGEELIRIEYAGICGSDMHAYHGHDERRPAPLILGHEVSGIIEHGERKGLRVAVNPLVECGTCEACQSKRENLCPNRQIISMPPREGGFAQFLKMPASNLVPIPDGVPVEHGALIEPLACGWHAVRLGLKNQDQSPENLRALVIGGGAIGLGAALSLRAQGVSDVTLSEANPKRLDFLRENTDQNALGAEELADGLSFDIVVDAVGYSATRSIASDRAKPGGVILHIGLGEASGGLDIRRMTLQEITFIGTYTYTNKDFEDTAKAAFTGALGPLDWVDIRPLAEGAAAFADIASGEAAAPKLMLTPWD